MSTLHVRNVPQELYRRVRQAAERQNRSLSAVVVELLEEGVEQQSLRTRQRRLMSVIRRRRRRSKPGPDASDSVRLIREDRRR